MSKKTNPPRKHGTWYAGEFQDYVRALNPRLFCYAGNFEFNKRFASVYEYLEVADCEDVMDTGEDMAHWRQICGIPVGWLPERTILEPDGKHIWKRGWREIVNVLVGRKLIRLPRELGPMPRHPLGNGGLMSYGTITQREIKSSLVSA